MLRNEQCHCTIHVPKKHLGGCSSATQFGLPITLIILLFSALFIVSLEILSDTTASVIRNNGILRLRRM